LAKFGFRLKREGAVSLDQWFSESLPMVGLWQRRLATEDAEGTGSCCLSLCSSLSPVVLRTRFRKIIKNLPNQAGDDPATSSEKFEQAFVEAFGRTENGSAKPPGILQQMFQQILRWRSRIG